MVQLVKDYEDYSEVNKQLELMYVDGYQRNDMTFDLYTKKTGVTILDKE